MSDDRYDTVFVSGIFNVLHPGHVRLLRFAKSLGDTLIVGVLSDEIAGEIATVPQGYRLEAIESLKVVDQSFIIEDSVNSALARTRPNLVVKGREHSTTWNSEEEIVRSYGGKLVFSSGDSFFSATDLLGAERDPRPTLIEIPAEYLKHHDISRRRLAELVDEMRALRVLVMGDVIIDEYISCQPLGMSREDPTLVVTPIDTNRFIGGAAIVAGHAASLGRAATLHSVTGVDEQAEYLREELKRHCVQGVIHKDDGRPTTTKQRFRAAGKTLLRVSRLRQDAISEALEKALIDGLNQELRQHDLLLFSDFNYGVLPQRVVDETTKKAKEVGLIVAADSQSSSQVGDISRFVGMDVITPTEYEARVACRNFDDGLVVLADQLREKSDAGIVLMTLAEDGVFMRGAAGSAAAMTDRLPAFNRSPVDVAGAGDSLLVVSSMALACGATMYEAALLGSLAAAVQVATTGNRPLTPERLLQAIGE